MPSRHKLKSLGDANRSLETATNDLPPFADGIAPFGRRHIDQNERGHLSPHRNLLDDARTRHINRNTASNQQPTSGLAACLTGCRPCLWLQTNALKSSFLLLSSWEVWLR